MEIREKIAQKVHELRTEDDYIPTSKLIDFILSKETLELLKPLYGVQEEKVAKIAYTLDKKEVGEDLLNLDSPEAKKYYFGLAKALSDGDVVGVRKK